MLTNLCLFFLRHDVTLGDRSIDRPAACQRRRFREENRLGDIDVPIARLAHARLRTSRARSQRSKAGGIDQSFRAIYPEGIAITRRVVAPSAFSITYQSPSLFSISSPKTGFLSHSSSRGICRHGGSTFLRHLR